MSWLRAALAVSFRKSSSVVRRRKHLEITELIPSEEMAFWKKHVSVPITEDCRDRDGTSHIWCVSMLDASPVTSAQPGSNLKPRSAWHQAGLCPAWVGWHRAGREG